MIKSLCVVVCFFLAVQGFPTQFDLRTQPSMNKYTDYALQDQGLCLGFWWSSQLAQILSNAYSLKSGYRRALSAQQILECTSSVTQKCHYMTRENVDAAISYIQTKPITFQQCYPNQPLQFPGQCKRTCQDGSEFPITTEASVIQHSKPELMLHSLTDNEVTAAFVVLKIYDSMNYYSSENPQNLKAQGSFYGYTFGEVVGWKEQGKVLVVRVGYGTGWGYRGFANLNVEEHADLIDGYYTLKTVDHLTLSELLKQK